MTFTVENDQDFARSLVELNTVLQASHLAGRQTDDPLVLKTALIELCNKTGHVLAPLVSAALDEYYRQHPDEKPKR